MIEAVRNLSLLREGGFLIRKMGMLKKCAMQLCTLALPVLAALTVATPALVHAAQDPDTVAQIAASGADASNPTAAVNYQDVRYHYFDLDRGADKHSFETEGAYMLHPRLKITNELRYVNTDSSGKSEQDFEELKLKGNFLTDIKPFGIKAKLAIGVEWLKDLGDFEKGTGSGADSIAPLAGIGWIPDDRNFIITLVQYFHSYDTDSARQEDVRETTPRLIWIRKLPDIDGWFKADLKMSIDHEDDENFDQLLELQLGKMLSPRVGLYGEVFLGDDVLDSNAYNYSVGAAVRFMY
jgi:hypothetical protein